MADEEKRFFQNLVHVHRFEQRFGRPGETEELVD